MRYTLLDITQRILSSMDSDEVNSIGDSDEATQVAYIVLDTYADIAATLDIQSDQTLFELMATGITTPVVMTRPEHISEVHWIKYSSKEYGDMNDRMRLLDYWPLHDFMNRMQMFDVATDSTISTCTLSLPNPTGVDSIELAFYNDRPPTRWTSFNDKYVIFDSYDSNVDGFLQKNKTECYGSANVRFNMTDLFNFPNLPEKHFPLLINEAKSTCFFELKQQPHAKAEQRAQKNWFQAKRQAEKLPDTRSFFDTLPNYGRRHR